MAVRIRLKRFGRRHRPTYRVTIIDRARQRDSKVLEEVGLYDPGHKDVDKQVLLKNDRIKHWLSVGATPSDTVRQLLVKGGIELKAKA